MERSFDQDEVVMQPFDKTQFIRILRYLIPQKKAVAAAAVLMCISAVAAQFGPYFFKIAIDQAIPQRDPHAAARHHQKNENKPSREYF